MWLRTLRTYAAIISILNQALLAPRPASSETRDARLSRCFGPRHSASWKNTHTDIESPQSHFLSLLARTIPLRDPSISATCRTERKTIRVRILLSNRASCMTGWMVIQHLQGLTVSSAWSVFLQFGFHHPYIFSVGAFCEGALASETILMTYSRGWIGS